MGVKAAGTPAVVQDLMPFRRPVVSSIALVNQRLQAAIPPASVRTISYVYNRD